MLHFFRRIRQRLLTENRFTKYLLYAIGEIMLVVIGILIALQVDTWNENRKSEERTKHLFSQVQKELLYNISRTDFAIDSYIGLDDHFHRVIKGKVTYQDYESDPQLCRLITNIDLGLEAQQTAYTQLLESEVSFTPQQDSIISELRNLYVLDLSKVKTYDNVLMRMAIDFRQKLKDEKHWYSDLIGGPGFSSSMDNAVSKEMVDYFLTDPAYLNEVQDFINVAYDPQLKSILGFRARALRIYNDLAISLEDTSALSLTCSQDDFSQYLGSYKNEKDSSLSYLGNSKAVISEELDQFYLHIYSDESLTVTFKICPYSKDAYIAYWEWGNEYRGVLNKFIEDESSGKVSIILVGDYGPKYKERPLFLKVD